MQIITHAKNNVQIAELVSDEVLIKTPGDGAQLIADLYYQGFDLIIIQAVQLAPSFFELKSGLAGEVLQKCSNWRIRLVITGDFTDVDSKSLRDFIFESNKGRQVNFLSSTAEALARAWPLWTKNATDQVEKHASMFNMVDSMLLPNPASAFST